MRFHPSVQILTWCMLVAALQEMTTGRLMMASGLILLCAILISGHKLILLLRRTRWVMLSLLLIYAFTTPGWALFELLGVFSPTREGLADGAIQMMRLLATLAALAILLESLHRQHLIAGLYTLFLPMRILGVSRERLAVRLALTLHYAEVTMLRVTDDWQSTLRSLFESHDEPVKHMELEMYRFGFMDAALLIVATMTIWLTLR